MANTKTAKKQLKINQRNRALNRRRLTGMRTAVRAFFASLEGAADEAEARAKLAYVQSLIHRNVAKGVLKKGTALRKVSRLYKHFNHAFGRKKTGADEEANASA